MDQLKSLSEFIGESESLDEAKIATKKGIYELKKPEQGARFIEVVKMNKSATTLNFDVTYHKDRTGKNPMFNKKNVSYKQLGSLVKSI